MVMVFTVVGAPARVKTESLCGDLRGLSNPLADRYWTPGRRAGAVLIVPNPHTEHMEGAFAWHPTSAAHHADLVEVAATRLPNQLVVTADRMCDQPPVLVDELTAAS